MSEQTTARTAAYEIRPDGDHFAIVRTAGRIGRVATVITEEDATAIVQACNAHDDLVAALDKFANDPPAHLSAEWFELCDQARAALAKASA